MFQVRLLHRSPLAGRRAENLSRPTPPQILPTTSPVSPEVPAAGSDCRATAHRVSAGARSTTGLLPLLQHWNQLAAGGPPLRSPSTDETRLSQSPRHQTERVGGAVPWVAPASEAFPVEHRLASVASMGEATPAALLQKSSQHCRGEMAIEYAPVPLLRLWRKILFARHFSQRRVS